MIYRIAHRAHKFALAIGVPPARSLEVDEYVSCGWIGYTEAVRSYNETVGSFDVYACRRIYGAMLDEGRNTSWFRRAKTDVKVVWLDCCEWNRIERQCVAFEQQLADTEEVAEHYASMLPRRRWTEFFLFCLACGWDQKSIAAMLGVSETHVSLLKKAIKKDWPICRSA